MGSHIIDNIHWTIISVIRNAGKLNTYPHKFLLRMWEICDLVEKINLNQQKKNF